MEERVAIGANVVHETIRREGEDELKRSGSALAWSGLAAGLSKGFSLVAEALYVAYLPDQPWRVTTGAENWGAFLAHFFFPTLLGNIVGGVSLVACLGHAQVVAGKDEVHPSKIAGK